jgi:dihydroorotate dehydrogenase electron transfer subunit
VSEASRETGRFREVARVVSLRELPNRYFTVTFSLPRIAAAATPSQFIMLSVRAPSDPGWDPLLPRPFTFLRVRPPHIEVYARVVGRGTALLRASRAGDEYLALGPLGWGFEPPRDRDAQPVFVAGGVGVAPFLHLAETLSGGRRPVLLYGGRRRADIHLVDELEAANMSVEVATEDGSLGTHGRVTVLLEKWLKRPAVEVFACGPEPMLEAVARMSRGRPCHVSLEARMGCGIGVCRGCAVPLATGGFAEICVAGPVREASEIWG